MKAYIHQLFSLSLTISSALSACLIHVNHAVFLPSLKHSNSASWHQWLPRTLLFQSFFSSFVSLIRYLLFRELSQPPHFKKPLSNPSHLCPLITTVFFKVSTVIYYLCHVFIHIFIFHCGSLLLDCIVNELNTLSHLLL